MFSPLSLGEYPAAVALILALWICMNRIYLSNLPEWAAGTVFSLSLSLSLSLAPSILSSLSFSSPNINPSIKVLNVLFGLCLCSLMKWMRGDKPLMGRRPSPTPLPLFSFDWMFCVLLNVTHRPDYTFTSGEPQKKESRSLRLCSLPDIILFSAISLENHNASLIGKSLFSMVLWGTHYLELLD